MASSYVIDDGGLMLQAAAATASLQKGMSSSISSLSDLTGSGARSGSSTGSAACEGGAASVGLTAAGCAAAAPFPDDGDSCGATGSSGGFGCFGAGMRTRSAGFMVPRNSARAGKTMMIFPVQPSTGSPNALRIVLLLVLFRTRPRLSLVNQTTSFFSLSAPTISSVTFLMRNFFSAARSSALRKRDWSYVDANNIIITPCSHLQLLFQLG